MGSARLVTVSDSASNPGGIGERLRRISDDFATGGFASDMASEDLLALVLRAHLWIERGPVRPLEGLAEVVEIE